MFQELRASLGLLALSIIVMGIGYPLLVMGAGQALFPHQASGSLVEKDGRIVGSALIGQNFADDKYFHSRPSAAGSGYDASNSSGSNLAPSSAALVKTVTERVAELRKDGNTRPIPIDLVTASGSGLDPDISVASAEYQAARIANVRNIPLAQIKSLIESNTTSRTFGVLGENRVNVLAINRALDLLPTPTAP
ncbi:MAG: potassium-transporting ATPase subunit KdpC [Alphaproteobacteria bacterium]|nr:potassium-transporting ATPase subunit KdpC [Alphaproteobacteria bacterium]